MMKGVGIILLMLLIEACGQQPAKLPEKAEPVRPAPPTVEEQRTYFPPDRVPLRNSEGAASVKP
ncbi:hypothetical protein O9H85_25505 [Paenibacillus filicis]|uniref:Uncharacterized protein n=1 Tax=Paenibacillus gyeongsangnamensis TaxID=3388067 RepID=A0ABT4QFX4_9BACL|nr:hypothetical protein [Paenibacillus filicis]MCZ8515707.1 hypothetical protein [Paenibacillus filicis]